MAEAGETVEVVLPVAIERSYTYRVPFGMALAGAELLLYPTAIGTEPVESDNDTRDPWQRAANRSSCSFRARGFAANRWRWFR